MESPNPVPLIFSGLCTAKLLKNTLRSCGYPYPTIAELGIEL
jgi:hypothetical protein